MDEPERGRVIFIEFDNQHRPFSVEVVDLEGYRTRYDVEWSKRDQTFYFSWCGSGYDGACYREHDNFDYWIAPGYRVTKGSGKRIKLPEPYREADEVLTKNSIEVGQILWCSRCRSWMEEDATCEHVFWCDECGWWSTPSERCHYQDGRAARTRKSA